MKISQAGLDLIKEFEHFEPRKYLCPAGKITIAWGHVIRGNDIFSEPITESQGEQLLRCDLEWVEHCIKHNVQVPLSQNEFDALCSFILNIGAAAFRGSTLLRKLNQGDRARAARELDKWNKVRGKILDGLIARREKEKRLFLTKEVALDKNQAS